MDRLQIRNGREYDYSIFVKRAWLHEACDDKMDAHLY